VTRTIPPWSWWTSGTRKTSGKSSAITRSELWGSSSEYRSSELKTKAPSVCTVQSPPIPLLPKSRDKVRVAGSPALQSNITLWVPLHALSVSSVQFLLTNNKNIGSNKIVCILFLSGQLYNIVNNERKSWKEKQHLSLHRKLLNASTVIMTRVWTSGGGGGHLLVPGYRLDSPKHVLGVSLWRRRFPCLGNISCYFFGRYLKTQKVMLLYIYIIPSSPV
jgi:hypothetical protein